MKKKYQPKREADENQVTALEKMRGKPVFALMMAPRTRKTKVVLDDFGELELAGKVKDLLVIAKAGVYRIWEEALGLDFSADLQKRMLVHVWESGNGVGIQKRRDAFLEETKRPRVLIMNVEALSRAGDARGFVIYFLQQNNNIAVVDESTIIKNHKSERTKFVIKKVKPLTSYRRILSGLMTPRSPLDLYHQFEFLDENILGFSTYIGFIKYVAHVDSIQFGGRWPANVVNKNKGENGFKPEAVAELQKLIEPHSFRVPFNPKVPSTFSMRHVAMTEEQEKHYEEIKEFATTELADKSHVTATVVIAQIMRMHQVLCGHVTDEEGNEHLIPEHRTEALLDLLEDYSGDKAVIWFSYTTNLKRCMSAIEKEYGPGSTARFYGGNLKRREKDEELFKTNRRCRFMGATPDSGGLGRTWDIADLAIYFSSKDNLEHRDQSEQRTMGKDKTRGVDNVDLICPGTIEWRGKGKPSILNSLRNKINMASVINGDNYRGWLI